MEGALAEAGTREVQFLKEITHLNDLLRLNKIDPRDPVIGPVPKLVEIVEGRGRGFPQERIAERRTRADLGRQ